MAKIRSLLIKHEVVSAGRKRKCYHSKDCQIVKGDFVLELKPGPQTPDGYCLRCSKAMVAKAREMLDQIELAIAKAEAAAE